MADDLTDSEAAAESHQGIENDDIGRILARLIRTARLLVNRGQALNDRVKALEDRVKALEGP